MHQQPQGQQQQHQQQQQQQQQQMGFGFGQQQKSPNKQSPFIGFWKEQQQPQQPQTHGESKDENNGDEGDLITCRGETPFIMAINGSVNGEAFAVEGRGCGNSLTGNVKGKWVCTSGKLPIAWAALAATIGYGTKSYTNYPNGITHFFQECLPEGYTQERVARFQNDGTLKSYHEITFNKGIIMNKVTVQGEGFKKDSPILNNGIKIFNPSTETTYPFDNGVRSMVHHVFPLKNGAGFIVCEQMTVNRPLGNGRNIRQPKYHFTRSHIRQSIDVDENSDHIIQEEVIEAYELKLLTPFKNCGLIKMSTLAGPLTCY